MTLQEKLLAIREWIHDIEIVENQNEWGLGDIEAMLDNVIDTVALALGIEIAIPETADEDL